MIYMFGDYLQFAHILVCNMEKVIIYNQTVIPDAFVKMVILTVLTRLALLMDLPVMQLVILTITLLICASMTFKEIVNMSLLNPVTTVNSLLLSLTVHTILMFLVLTQ